MRPGRRGFLQAQGWTKDASRAKSLMEAKLPGCWPRTPALPTILRGLRASSYLIGPRQGSSGQARTGQDRRPNPEGTVIVGSAPG